MPKQNEERDVGEMGENTLALWASQSGVTANRVQRDRTGWDTLLEFPLERSSMSSGALDRAREPLKCLVQVKSSDKKEKRVRISASNLHLLVLSGFPAFVLVFHFDGQDLPRRAHLIHVDRDLASLVLRRVREASANGNTDRLHLRMESLPLTGKNQLLSPSAEQLVSAIRLHVPDGMPAYMQRKQDWTRTVGYERENQRLRFDFEHARDGRSLDEQILDFFIGIEPLRVTKGEIRDIRFGIGAPEALHEFEAGATIQVEPAPFTTGNLTFIAPDGRSAPIEGKLFGPPGEVLSQIGFDAVKVRFESPYLRGLFPIGKIDGGPVHVNVHMPGGDEDVPIAELGRASEAILLIAESRQPNPVHFTLSFAGKDWKGFLAMDGGIDEEGVKRAQAGAYAWQVARRFDLPATTKVQIGSLLAQSLRLDMAHAILTGTVASQVITGDPGCELDRNREVCVPLVLPVRIGDFLCVMAGAMFGLPVTQTGGTAFQLEHVRWQQLRHVTLRRGTPWPVEGKALIEEIAERFGHDAEVVRWWDRKTNEAM